jgi:hypothetical protein
MAKIKDKISQITQQGPNVKSILLWKLIHANFFKQMPSNEAGPSHITAFCCPLFKKMTQMLYHK